MIAVQNLVRRYGPLVAVDGISFALDKGEVVGFLGPNGAGKTTTMRILAGYLPATSATRLEVAGFDVLRDSLAVRGRIGYLAESVPLYRELRVSEMLWFQGRLHGMGRAALRARIPEVLERVGVRDRERQLIGKLSRGLRQRVGLAVALLPGPEVLILDEPTSGLDPLQRIEVRGLIRELAAEHTVLLSSHILAEVESICARVLVIHQGRLVADGRQDELVSALAGPGHVRFEAAVGRDSAAARALIASLPGVQGVEDRGKLGIHWVFEVHGEGDLREDLGALALARGWAVRELSWQRPRLEEVFARLVLGGELPAGPALSGPPQAGAERPVAVSVATPAQRDDAFVMLETGSQVTPAAEPAVAPRVLYTLNPFDRGASRDLSQPMAVEPPATGTESGARPDEKPAS